jgi:hypothetical protein
MDTQPRVGVAGTVRRAVAVVFGVAVLVPLAATVAQADPYRPVAAPAAQRPAGPVQPGTGPTSPPAEPPDDPGDPGDPGGPGTPWPTTSPDPEPSATATPTPTPSASPDGEAGPGREKCRAGCAGKPEAGDRWRDTKPRRKARPRVLAGSGSQRAEPDGRGGAGGTGDTQVGGTERKRATGQPLAGTVTPPDAQARSQSGGALPTAGAEWMGSVGAGLILLGVGIQLARAGRRRLR